MKKILFLFVFCTLLMPRANANVEWQKFFGADIEDIHQTTDGGYIAVGSTGANDGYFTGNHGSYDAFVVKLSSSGAIEWVKCLGGQSVDYGYSIQQTMDGGFIMAGATLSNDGDVSGGHGRFDCWVVKLSAGGALVWQKCYGGGSSEGATSIKQTLDGGYIFSGGTTSGDGEVTGIHGASDVWVVKLSDTGRIEWQNAYGGSDYDDDGNDYYFNSHVSICQTYDGGYAFASTTKSTDGDITGQHGMSDIWVVRLSAAGSLEWQKTLGGTLDDRGYSIQQTFDSGCIVTGYTWSDDGDVNRSPNEGCCELSLDLWVVKLSLTGAIQWNRTYDHEDAEAGYSICQTADTGYIVCGSVDRFQQYKGVTSVSGSSLLTVRLSATGDVKWQSRLGGETVRSYASGSSISPTSDGGFIIGGKSDTDKVDHLEYGGWIIKIGDKPSGVEAVGNSTAIAITPNPATNELIVNSAIAITDISICNLTGQMVYTNKYHAKDVWIDITSLASGMYLVRINSTEVRKFVKQ